MVKLVVGCRISVRCGQNTERSDISIKDHCIARLDPVWPGEIHYIPVWCAPVLAVFYIIHIILYYMVPSIYLYLHLCMSLMLVGEERRRVAPRRHFLTGWGF